MVPSTRMQGDVLSSSLQDGRNVVRFSACPWPANPLQAQSLENGCEPELSQNFCASARWKIGTESLNVQQPSSRQKECSKRGCNVRYQAAKQVCKVHYPRTHLRNAEGNWLTPPPLNPHSAACLRGKATSQSERLWLGTAPMSGGGKFAPCHLRSSCSRKCTRPLSCFRLRRK